MLIIDLLAKVVFFGPQMGPQMDPKMGPQRDRKWVPKWTRKVIENGYPKGYSRFETETITQKLKADPKRALETRNGNDYPETRTGNSNSN